MFIYNGNPWFFKAFHKLILFINYTFSLRMRRKNWKNPASVYVDSQVFEENIQVYASFEVFLEVLEGILYSGLYSSELEKHLD